MKFKIMVGAIVDVDIDVLLDLNDILESIKRGGIHAERAVVHIKDAETNKLVLDFTDITVEVNKGLEQEREV